MAQKRPEAQLSLWQEASKLKSLDKDVLFDLFDLLQAPSSLQSFFLLIPLLPEIFNAAADVAKISDLDPGRFLETEETVNALDFLLPQLQNNFKAKNLHPPIPTPRHGPFTGILEKHPLYSFLGESVPHKKYHKRFIFLQAQVLVAMDILGPVHGDQLKALLTSFRCLRKISIHQHWDNLKSLPNEVVSIDSFFEIIQAQFDRTPFHPIGNLFLFAKHGITRKMRKKAIPPEKSYIPPLKNIEDDEELTQIFFREVRPATALSDEGSKDYRSHGGLPEEIGQKVDFEPVPSEDKYHGATRRQLAFQAKRARNRRAMLNQFCSLAWNQANLYDLDVLCGFLEGTQHLPNFDFGLLSKIKAVALLSLVFFTCNPLERLLALPVFSEAEPRFNSPEGFFWRNNKDPLVRLHSPGPELANRSAVNGAFQVEEFVHIPLPEFFYQCLGTDNHSMWKDRPHLFEKLDPENPEAINEVYSISQNLLEELNRENGARLSLGKIGSYLLYRLAEEEQCDLPSAFLFFGRNDKSVRTRIHYTLASAPMLEKGYRRCSNEMMHDLNRSVAFDDEKSVNSDHYLGTPFCPTLATVRRITRELQNAVKNSQKASLTLRHNVFALFTSMLIAFGTGFRAIRDPGFQEVEIDYDYGIGIVSDKGDVPYRSRYVYLAPVVLEQITNYRRHLQIIYDRLGTTNPSLFDSLKTLDFEGLSLTLFWLRGEAEPIEVLSPGMTKRILKQNHNYTMPINSGRHYLKYRLLNQGCSPELIEAQLGHWSVGQEPWGYFSNLDPLDFAEQMARHIPNILHQDGWRAIRGLG